MYCLRRVHELLYSQAVTLANACCCFVLCARSAQVASLFHRIVADKTSSDDTAAAAQAEADQLKKDKASACFCCIMLSHFSNDTACPAAVMCTLTDSERMAHVWY
jgi:hypothetical protein